MKTKTSLAPKPHGEQSKLNRGYHLTSSDFRARNSFIIFLNHPTLAVSCCKEILHFIFEGGIFVKFLNGLFELMMGLFLLLVPVKSLNGAVLAFFRSELFEDPTDAMVHLLLRVVNSLSHWNSNCSLPCIS